MRLQSEIPARLHDDGAIDAVAFERHPAHEGVVANHVDGSRNPAGALVNERDGLTSEDARSHTAGGGKSARNIRSRVPEVEGLEVASKRHALLQLSKVRILESLSQLGLSGQDQREELA